MGELRSFVTAFFNLAPPWIEFNSAPLPADDGGGPAAATGGGGGPGGGGGGIAAQALFFSFFWFQFRWTDPTIVAGESNACVWEEYQKSEKMNEGTGAEVRSKSIWIPRKSRRSRTFVFTKEIQKQKWEGLERSKRNVWLTLQRGTEKRLKWTFKKIVQQNLLESTKYKEQEKKRRKERKEKKKKEERKD